MRPKNCIYKYMYVYINLHIHTKIFKDIYTYIYIYIGKYLPLSRLAQAMRSKNYIYQTCIYTYYYNAFPSYNHRHNHIYTYI
jgi:hypothetical protein